MLIELTAVDLDAAALDALAARLRLPDGFAVDPQLTATLREALEAARIVVERESGRALTVRRFRAVADHWGEGVALQVSPVSALVGVVLIDAEGVETALAPEGFRVDDLAPTVLARAIGDTAPAPPPLGCVAVDFEAGYGPAWTDAPWDLRAATLAQAAAIYERGAAQDFAGDLTPNAAALLAPYRKVRL